MLCGVPEIRFVEARGVNEAQRFKLVQPIVYLLWRVVGELARDVGDWDRQLDQAKDATVRDGKAGIGRIVSPLSFPRSPDQFLVHVHVAVVRTLGQMELTCCGLLPPAHWKTVNKRKP